MSTGVNLRGIEYSQRGSSLAEATVAVAIAALISVAFLSTLATLMKGSSVAEEQATADTLARNQMEYLKSMAYINYAVPGHAEYALVTAPATYELGLSAAPINPLTGQALAPGTDEGMQKIIVSVVNDGRSLVTIESFKVNR